MLSVTALFTSCLDYERDVLQPAPVAAGDKVSISFKVAVPGRSAETKAMGIVPEIDNMYVAVFGGNGFFNEWVPATIQSATEANYDGTAATIYTVKVNLTISNSRLRLHFIANCPEKFKNNPPISGTSSQNLEDVVMAKLRSQIGDTYNDAYWQKVLLPNGVKAQTQVGQDGVTEEYVTDQEGNPLATPETIAQFPDPIPLVRNFARIYLRNLANDVTIYRYGLVNAPAEGCVAPILATPYTSHADGSYFENPNLDDENVEVYYESFFINYQNVPLIAENEGDPTLADPPYNYKGYSPTDLVFGSYPDPNDPTKDPTIPSLEEMLVWDSGASSNAPLFVYERSTPTKQQPATRIIIYALKEGEVDGEGNPLPKYYALDIVDDNTEYLPLLRNNTYTVKLLGIELGSGETSIGAAAGASSASVSGDISTQYVTEISDGTASIGTSYTEKLYVKPGTYDVMFRYIPTSVTKLTDNDLVSLKIGLKDEEHGTFQELDPSNPADVELSALALSGGAFSAQIDKSDGHAVLYVHENNAWRVATAAEVADDDVDKWSRIIYTTVSDGIVDSDGYFTETKNVAIRVIGTNPDSGTSIYRDVLVKLSPRKILRVECLDKYVNYASGEKEVVRIYIPDDLPRSVFPLQFNLEPTAHSLTPDGDVLPVASGASIIPGYLGPAYHFVKSLTLEQYTALPIIRIGSINWKYFDCHFKTTLADNASTVYVRNEYFNDSGADDDFRNFHQRAFDNLNFSGTIVKDQEVTFNFRMDYEHRNSATSVWWDPENALDASLSENNMVLPYSVLVKLTGLEPAIDGDGHNKTTKLQAVEGHDDLYLYHVGAANEVINSSTTPYGSMQLVAVGEHGPCLVELSTENIDSNPDLYHPNSLSAPLYGLRMVSASGTLALNNSTAYNYSNNTDYAIGSNGATVRFTNTDGHRTNNWGSYTYRGRYIGTNSASGSITINAPSGTNSAVTRVVLTYYQRSQTETCNTGSISVSGNTATWTGSAASVTISMPRGNNTNSRNSVSNIQVTYTYEGYDEL